MLARSIIRLCQRRVYVHIGLIEGSATCLFAVRDLRLCLNFVCACALADEFVYLHMRINAKICASCIFAHAYYMINAGHAHAHEIRNASAQCRGSMLSLPICARYIPANISIHLVYTVGPL